MRRPKVSTAEAKVNILQPNVLQFITTKPEKGKKVSRQFY
jgi:hypothetical protein